MHVYVHIVDFWFSNTRKGRIHAVLNMKGKHTFPCCIHTHNTWASVTHRLKDAMVTAGHVWALCITPHPVVTYICSTIFHVYTTMPEAMLMHWTHTMTQCGTDWDRRNLRHNWHRELNGRCTCWPETNHYRRHQWGSLHIILYKDIHVQSYICTHKSSPNQAASMLFVC